MIRRTLHVLLVLVAAFALAACGGGADDDAGSPPPASEDAGAGGSQPASVELVDFSIEAPASVVAGTQIEVTNSGEAPHTFTADDGTFDTGNLASGDTATVTIDEPGSYPYTCTIHPDQMNGTLEVTSADG